MIALPDGVESIGEGAFAGSSVSIIRLPESVKTIADTAFEGCDGLTALVADGSNAQAWCEENGVDCQTEATAHDFTYTTASGKVSITEYTGSSRVVIVPSFIEEKPVTSVKMANNANVTHVFLPNTITKLGDEVFSGCGSLTSVVMPQNITAIGVSAFSGCDKLTITTVENSFAHNWCIEHSIPFTLV